MGIKNWQTIKDLLAATVWGVLVLLRGPAITTEQFMGPFTTAMGCDCHRMSTCPVLYDIEMLCGVTLR